MTGSLLKHYSVSEYLLRGTRLNRPNSFYVVDLMSFRALFLTGVAANSPQLCDVKAAPSPPIGVAFLIQFLFLYL